MYGKNNHHIVDESWNIMSQSMKHFRLEKRDWVLMLPCLDSDYRIKFLLHKKTIHILFHLLKYRLSIHGHAWMIFIILSQEKDRFSHLAVNDKRQEVGYLCLIIELTWHTMMTSEHARFPRNGKKIINIFTASS